MSRVEFDITPIGKPRMSQSDRWAHRPVVDAYYAFKDELNLKANLKRFSLPDQFEVVFHLPMPPSWSQKKRTQMEGRPHQQKPDLDNCVKSLLDCLKPDDSTVWDIQARKLWAQEGRIVIYTNGDHE